MRLPRLTTRRLMRFVAVFALILAMMIGVERRKQTFLARAMESSDRLMNVAHDSGLSPEARRQARKRRDYYRRLNKKYVHAARYPWLPVDPDPPMP